MPTSKPKYFLNGKTIHLVGAFPPPKRAGHTQCGRATDSMTQITLAKAKNPKVGRVCTSCWDRAGAAARGSFAGM